MEAKVSVAPSQAQTCWKWNVCKKCAAGHPPITKVSRLFTQVFIFLGLFCFAGLLSTTSTHTQQAAEENRQAIILFAIIALFVICHMPRNFLNIHEALTFETKKQDYLHNCGGMPLWILLIGLISHLLLTFNSAFNFFLYCAMSDVFRKELLSLWRRWTMSAVKLFNKGQSSFMMRRNNSDYIESHELTLTTGFVGIGPRSLQGSLEDIKEWRRPKRLRIEQSTNVASLWTRCCCIQ